MQRCDIPARLLLFFLGFMMAQNQLSGTISMLL